jgi:hypothetical protein
MRFKQLDTVVLDRDLPECGLRRGDLGAVVEIYEPDGIEIEFAMATGKVATVITLHDRDGREIEDGDLMTVRHFDPAG